MYSPKWVLGSRAAWFPYSVAKNRGNNLRSWCGYKNRRSNITYLHQKRLRYFLKCQSVPFPKSFEWMKSRALVREHLAVVWINLHAYLKWGLNSRPVYRDNILGLGSRGRGDRSSRPRRRRRGLGGLLRQERESNFAVPSAGQENTVVTITKKTVQKK